MSDFDRFTEFLRREARGYHEPPEVPVEVMWRGVEGRMADAGAPMDDVRESVVDDGVKESVDYEVVDALGYNAAPATPREEMWGRIEAAWAMREAEEVGDEAPSGRMAAIGGAVGRITASRRRLKRRQVAGWAAGLAAAASLVLGIAFGRDLGPPQPGGVGTVGTETEARGARQREEAVAVTPSESAAPSVTVADRAGPGATAEPEPDLPLVAARRAPPPTAAAGEAEPQVDRVTAARRMERRSALPSSITVRRDHETIRYLGRAETLLTAFRTDQRTSLTERDLASWGRELLIETRMRLDLPVSRTPEELALLEDLELVLLQISRLGSGAPDVEWQLARESMALKGALPRVRAATATDGP